LRGSAPHPGEPPGARSGSPRGDRPAGPFGGNRRWLFRSYFVIVGGLILIAAAFDYVFSRLEPASDEPERPWVASSLRLIEARLAAVDPDDWDGTAAALAVELGLPLRVLPGDQVVQAAATEATLQPIRSAEGNTAWLLHSARLDATIQLGPVAPSAGTRAHEGIPIALIPPLFYLSIFVLVSLWFWPLLRDVRLLSAAARDFAADIRRPMQTAAKTSALRELATTFDDMAARIRSLLQEQKDLTSAISHEIRTPLSRIRFALAVMGDRGGDAAEIEGIEQDVRQIDALVGTMLDYARLEHPDLAVNWQLVPIDAWLERIVQRATASHESLRFVVEAPPEQVQMDPYLMEMALSNLLVNACRYAHSRVRISFASVAGTNRLSVDDDGPGIPQPKLETVFKPFTRLDDSRSLATGGYGLGLAIVSRIAERHGGRAEALKSADGGASLVVRWPAGAAAA
jgi:signal transduction histidine kinase